MPPGYKDGYLVVTAPELTQEVAVRVYLGANYHWTAL